MFPSETQYSFHQSICDSAVKLVAVPVCAVMSQEHKGTSCRQAGASLPFYQLDETQLANQTLASSLPEEFFLA